MNSELEAQSASPEATLFIVATPIGNLGDWSQRAKNIMAAVDLVAAEDTRRTRQLLGAMEIRPQAVVSYFDAKEEQVSHKIVERMLNEGISVALVSDAGTPCIADPGYRLVALARKHGLRVVGIPGPSALTTLVSISGLPNHKFIFVGFLAAKASARKKEIAKFRQYECSVVFYETARRLEATLIDISEVYPDAVVCVGRELTKAFEESLTAPISEVLAWCRAHQFLKGELVLMLDLPQGAYGFDGEMELNEETLRREIESRLARGLSTKDIVGELRYFGFSRSFIYSEVLSLSKASDEQPLN